MNNYLKPWTDEENRADPEYDPNYIPKFKVRRTSAGIWEAEKAGVVIMALTAKEVVDVAVKAGWAE